MGAGGNAKFANSSLLSFPFLVYNFESNRSSSVCCLLGRIQGGTDCSPRRFPSGPSHPNPQVSAFEQGHQLSVPGRNGSLRHLSAILAFKHLSSHLRYLHRDSLHTSGHSAIWHSKLGVLGRRQTASKNLQEIAGENGVELRGGGRTDSEKALRD